MLDKEKACSACSGSGRYCGKDCGACNGTGFEYSKDEIIEALEAELEQLQKTAHNSEYKQCKYNVDTCVNLKMCNQCYPKHYHS